jgi:hypothetical protein
VQQNVIELDVADNNAAYMHVRERRTQLPHITRHGGRRKRAVPLQHLEEVGALVTFLFHRQNTTQFPGTG